MRTTIKAVLVLLLLFGTVSCGSLPKYSNAESNLAAQKSADSLRLDPTGKYRLGLEMVSSANLPAGEIFGSHTVTQSFKADSNKLARIQVYLATFARTNTSTLRIDLENSDQSLIYTKTIPSSPLKDNSFFSFDFPAISNSANRIFWLKLSSKDAKTGNAITAWMSKVNIYPKGKLLVQGVPQTGDLILRLWYSRK
jgi:hypothetical protein